MARSLITPEKPALHEGASLALEPSPAVDDSDRSREDDEDDEQDVERAMRQAPRTGSLSDEVLGLREWATRRLFPLRTRRHVRQVETARSTVLQLTRGDLAITANRVEIFYEGRLWRIKDWNGVVNLKQDGMHTREANLTPGTEVTLAGRIFIAESARSIALRSFCARLLGWSDDDLAVVDRALRAIRLASAGRAALVLRGRGDLVPIAHTIHRHVLGDQAPFVVADPRRKNTSATVRSPANCARGMEAFRRASGGTLCARVRRLPPDFEEVLRALREPESGVQLMACSEGATVLGAAHIDVPSLDTRRADLPRIVNEYVEDVVDLLQAPDDCLDPEDTQWIMNRATLAREITIPDIEKAVLRTVAVRMTRDLTKAARLLGMTRVSLKRWMRRRG